jgi:tetratricopeptide (TPR) repeat protein
MKNQELFQELDEVQRLFNSNAMSVALKKIDRIIKRHDRHHLPYNYRGIIFLANQNFSQALIDFKKSISINQAFSEGYCNLGNTYQALNDYKKSLEAYNQALNIDYNNLQIQANIGMLYFKMGEYQSAIETYRKILKIDNKLEYVHQLIADAYSQESSHDKSLEHHQEALKLNPTNYLNYFFIGRDYLWRGDKKQAQEYFKKSLQFNSRYCPSYLAITKLNKIDIGGNVYESIYNLLQENLNDLENAYLNFSMAKIFEDNRDYEQSFLFLSRGNKNMKDHNKFHFPNFKNEMVKAIDFFTQKIDLREFEDKDAVNNLTPIFILGMPRSGSSLIEQILSNHPEVHGAGELDTLHQSLLKFVKENFSNTKSIDNDFYALRKKYLNRLRNITSKPFIIDKLPLNFFWIGYIKKLLPNAKFIHTTRNPIATSFSIYKTLFSEGSLEFAYDEDDIIAFYGIQNYFMDFWYEKYSSDIFSLNYDYFIENSEQEAKELFDFVGLDYLSEYLDLKKNQRSVMTASDLQVRDKIYKESSYKWNVYKVFLKKFESTFNKPYDKNY